MFLIIFNRMISLIYTNFVKSGKAELGSAGEQPNRNNLTDWNGQGEFNSPLFKNHSYHYAYKNSKIIWILTQNLTGGKTCQEINIHILIKYCH